MFKDAGVYMMNKGVFPMKQLSDIFSKQRQTRSSFRRNNSYQLLSDHWDDIFSGVAKDLRFGFVKDSVIHIYTSNPTWKTEIAYFETQFIEKMNQRLGKKTPDICKIKIHVETSKKERVTKSKNSKTNVKSLLNLDERIRNRRKRKLEMGYQPCYKCGIVLTLKSACVFCKTHSNIKSKEI